MDKDKLSKYRSEVIERFINVEWMINAIISQHYFKGDSRKGVRTPFMLKVLYDPYFSFPLRRQILEKILKKNKEDKKTIHKTMKDLYRLNTIRNYFAHCGQEFIILTEKPLKRRAINPEDIEQELDFESLYTEFMKTVQGIEQYLVKLQYALGVTLITKLPETQ